LPDTNAHVTQKATGMSAEGAPNGHELVDAQRAQRAEERALFDRYARERTPAAREAIVTRFLPLTRQLARRYGHGADLEDLEQVAALGLVKAIERFEPERGLAFSSFAFPTIAGEIKRYLRDHAWSVRVPRGIQETYLRIDRATSELTAQLGRAPTAGELAERVGASVESVLEARSAVTARRAVSLDQPTRSDEDDAISLGSLVGVEETGFEEAENAAVLDNLMHRLNDRERLLLRLRFEEDLTQTEIGERVGISQMHVSRLIRGAIARLQVTADSPPAREDRSR
jgi:RNA polymerase sigma-B factor